MDGEGGCAADDAGNSEGETRGNLYDGGERAKGGGDERDGLYGNY